MRLFNKFKKADNNISLTNLKDEPYKPVYFDACKFIWKNYIPQSGPSNVLQGELLRELEKLRWEAQENGNINWDEDFSYFCDFIKDTLCAQTIYNEDEKTKIKLILSYLQECGDYSLRFHNFEIPDDELDAEKIAYVYDNLYDIIADAIGQLQVRHPAPIPFEPNSEIAR